jgi:transposase
MYIEIKKIKGREYVYLTEQQKIDGKSKRVWQKYLGPLSKIQDEINFNLLKNTDNYQITTLEFGLPYFLYQLANSLKIQDIIDNTLPKRKQGFSFGEYFLIASLNRCIKPVSKSNLSEWYQKSYLKYLISDPKTYLNSTAYTNHFEALKVEDIENIELQVNKQLIFKFGIQTDQLFYDPTNFFTFINPRMQELPRHGKSKENRHTLNLVSLSLVCTQDGGIPLLHRVYPGNIQDAGHFKTEHQKIIERLKQLNINPTQVRLIFDKGNISANAIKGLVNENIRFICSIRPSTQKELRELLATDFELKKLPNGKEVGIKEFQQKFHGNMQRLIVSYNPNIQIWTGRNKIIKLLQRIIKVNDWFHNEKKRLNTHKWRTIESVEKKIQTLIGGSYLPLIKYQVNIVDDKIDYHIEINDEVLIEELEKLGKSYYMTNDFDIDPLQAIWLYRQQYNVENAFSMLKARDCLNVSPILHSKDESIRGHIFCCILGLLLTTLMKRELCQKFPNMSYKQIIQALENIKVAEIKFPNGHIKRDLILDTEDAKLIEKKLKFKNVLKKLNETP